MALARASWASCNRSSMRCSRFCNFFLESFGCSSCCGDGSLPLIASILRVINHYRYFCSSTFYLQKRGSQTLFASADIHYTCDFRNCGNFPDTLQVCRERVSISQQNFFRGQVQCHARASRQNQRRGAFCPCVYFSRHVTCPPRLEDTASVGGLQPVLMVPYPYHLNRSFKLTKRWLPITR